MKVVKSMARWMKGTVKKRVVLGMLAVAAAGLLAVTGAQATVTYGGDIDPTTDPASWTGARCWIGKWSDGWISIDGGSTVTSGYSILGFTTSALGTVTVDGQGSSWTAANVSVGFRGRGALTVTNGGTVNAALSIIANDPGTQGTAVVDGSGSKWVNSGTLTVGYYGTGSLTISNGGYVSNTDAVLGSITYSSYIGNGIVKVNGSGSTWTNNGTLSVGSSGTGRLSIGDGGAVTASAVSINSASTLTTDVGSSLTVGSGSGAITNDGTVRMVAGTGAASGTYSPITGAWTNNGTVQVLGGVLNSDYSVTVNPAASGTVGTATTIDLATTQRIIFFDATGNPVVGAGFQATTDSTSLTLTASAISGAGLTSLQALLGADEAVLSGWDFTTTGYTSGDPVYLSLYAGSGQTLLDLSIWHYDGSSWSAYDAYDLAYDGTYAGFTVTDFSGYAVSGTAPVPIPAAAWLLGSGLAGLAAVRRRRCRKQPAVF